MTLRWPTGCTVNENSIATSTILIDSPRYGGIASVRAVSIPSHSPATARGVHREAVLLGSRRGSGRRRRPTGQVARQAREITTDMSSTLCGRTGRDEGRGFAVACPRFLVQGL
jgi:hypothetical protein